MTIGTSEALANALARLKAIDIRHHHIQNDDIEGAILEGFQRLKTILHRHDLVARILQCHLDQRRDRGVVVGDKDAARRIAIVLGTVGKFGELILITIANCKIANCKLQISIYNLQFAIYNSLNGFIHPAAVLGALGGARNHDRVAAALHDLGVDDTALDMFLRRDLVHNIEQHFLDVVRSARAPVREASARWRSPPGHRASLPLNMIERQHFLILLDHGVARLCENTDHRGLVERLQSRKHRQTPDELGDKPIAQQIIWRRLRKNMLLRIRIVCERVLEPKAALAANPLRDDLIQSLKCTAADKQYIGRVEGNVLLLRMFAARQRRHMRDNSPQGSSAAPAGLLRPRHRA